MSAVLHIVGLLLLAAVCVIALASLVLGLPGTLLVCLAAIVYAWATGFAAVTWGTIGWLAVLALVGETLEFLSGAVGAGTERPSRRVAAAALGGGLIGGIVGTPFLFGVGSLFGALIGAFAGAAVARRTEGGDSASALRSGMSAMTGRFLGFVAKMAVAVVMLIVLFTAAI